MVFKHLRSKYYVLVKMFSTLVLFLLFDNSCNNLFNSGNQQERRTWIIASSTSTLRTLEAKNYLLGGFAEGEGSVSASAKRSVKVQFPNWGKCSARIWCNSTPEW